MRWLYEKSRWLHKVLGLSLILYCLWMGLSGILVNHPELFGEISTPGWLVPPQYRLADWNRGALVDLVYSPDDPDVAWASGNEGVWRTGDGGVTFHPLDAGFPSGPRARRTHSLLLVPDGPDAGLWAGTAVGLYHWPAGDSAWRAVPLGSKSGSHAAVRTVLRAGDRILAFTADGAWERAAGETDFRRRAMRRAAAPAAPAAPVAPVAPVAPASAGVAPAPPPERVSLVTYFFDAHSGRLFGLPGRLVMDAAGIVLVYLSFSALYLWFVPWRRKRLVRRGVRPKPRRRIARRVFRVLFDTHLEIGIWVAPLFLVLAATGFFLRPPLLAALVGRDVPASWFPERDPANPWEERIRRAMVHDDGERLTIEADDGFWDGSVDFDEPFHPFDLALPVHVMGTSVLRPTRDGGVLAASFSGAFRLEPRTGRIVDLVTGTEPEGEVSRLRTAEHMVTGVFTTPAGEEFLSTHRGGLVPLNGAERAGRFAMPEEMARRHRMSLWNWMFELHNSRIFKDAIGGFYLLIPPLGSLLFALLTVTGVWDWLYLRVVVRRRAARKAAS